MKLKTAWSTLLIYIKMDVDKYIALCVIYTRIEEKIYSGPSLISEETTRTGL
jgi:hypothetical protein